MPRVEVAASNDFERDLLGVAALDGVPSGVGPAFLFVGVCLSLRIFLLVVLEAELSREKRRMSCLGAVWLAR